MPPIRSILSFLHDLETRLARPATILIGIDGPGGCGKSTLAHQLAAHSSQITIVAMDDFYRPAAERRSYPAEEIAAHFDWRRLRDQVLIPLTRGKSARYQRYDWPDDRLADWRTVPPGGMVVVEGVYATKCELRDFYHLRIWLTCPPAVRLAHGIARDGESARDRWVNEWMPMEDQYIAVEHPEQAAHLIVDGTGSLGHDKGTENVCGAGPASPPP